MWQCLMAKRGAGSSRGGRLQADHRSQSHSCKHCQPLAEEVILAEPVPTPKPVWWGLLALHLPWECKERSSLLKLVGKTQTQFFYSESQGAWTSLEAPPKTCPCLDSGANLVVVKEDRGIQG